MVMVVGTMSVVVRSCSGNSTRTTVYSSLQYYEEVNMILGMLFILRIVFLILLGFVVYYVFYMVIKSSDMTKPDPPTITDLEKRIRQLEKIGRDSANDDDLYA